jgi:hypothetical protein
LKNLNGLLAENKLTRVRDKEGPPVPS